MAKQRSKNTGSLFKRIPTGPWVAAWYDHTGKRRVRPEPPTRPPPNASSAVDRGRRPPA